MPGVALGLGTIAGVALGWVRTPSLVASALAMDEHFALKERVTTLLTLTPELASSPAGQALLYDVGPRVEKLHVGSGFPLLPSWQASVMPLGAMILAVAACFLDPWFGSLHFNAVAAASVPEQKVDVKEVEKQLDNLRKVANEKKEAGAESSKEMKELLEEWDKLVNKPVDATKPDEVRERLSEMRNLEQKMKERADELKAQGRRTTR